MITVSGHVRTLIATTALGLAVGVLAPSPAPPSPAGPKSASDAFSSAVTSLHGLGYNVTATTGSTASGGTGSATGVGSVDSGAKAATIEFKGTEQGIPIDVAFTEIGGAMYTRLDIGAAQSQLGVDPHQWLSLDPTKLTNPQKLPFDMSGQGDAFDIAGLMTSTNDVQYPNPSDPTHVTGTVDLASAEGVSAPDPSDLGNGGVKASETPFSATIDSQGRLTDLKIDADAFDGNLTKEIKFTDFGAPKPVSAPASSVPAPSAVYTFFNS